MSRAIDSKGISLYNWASADRQPLINLIQNFINVNE